MASGQVHGGRELTMWKSDIAEAYHLMPMHPAWQIKQILVKRRTIASSTLLADVVDDNELTGDHWSVPSTIAPHQPSSTASPTLAPSIPCPSLPQSAPAVNPRARGYHWRSWRSTNRTNTQTPSRVPPPCQRDPRCHIARGLGQVRDRGWDENELTATFEAAPPTPGLWTNIWTMENAGGEAEDEGRPMVWETREPRPLIQCSPVQPARFGHGFHPPSPLTPQLPPFATSSAPTPRKCKQVETSNHCHRLFTVTRVSRRPEAPHPSSTPGTVIAPTPLLLAAYHAEGNSGAAASAAAHFISTGPA
ncbi:hypothetical protein GALMADRAFT_148802 [Galerina marginata CBS 339.88]|uniref:Uncharacterized protein n=1 Tax=Galerina marginata (strain CBS 339.88) TaxID=685588 RepID=A0A067S393_GALM3|nr:hypothetical protein GALMADRAFT_148802 [Galerina marginata CBS 339.88]